MHRRGERARRCLRGQIDAEGRAPGRVHRPLGTDRRIRSSPRSPPSWPHRRRGRARARRDAWPPDRLHARAIRCPAGGTRSPSPTAFRSASWSAASLRLPGAENGELPVDFRYCRQPSCAPPGPAPGLTSSRRRVTEFTSVEDLRRLGGPVRVTYWLYRPGMGWERLCARAGAPRSRRRLSTPAQPRGRPGAGPARDAAGQGPLRVPARRRATMALADRLSPGDLGSDPSRPSRAAPPPGSRCGSGGASRWCGRRRSGRARRGSPSRPRSRSAGRPSR